MNDDAGAAQGGCRFGKLPWGECCPFRARAGCDSALSSDARRRIREAHAAIAAVEQAASSGMPIKLFVLRAQRQFACIFGARSRR
jgi:hypothetical protein